jgi:hypothetical protein
MLYLLLYLLKTYCEKMITHIFSTLTPKLSIAVLFLIFNNKNKKMLLVKPLIVIYFTRYLHWLLARFNWHHNKKEIQIATRYHVVMFKTLLNSQNRIFCNDSDNRIMLVSASFLIWQWIKSKFQQKTEHNIYSFCYENSACLHSAFHLLCFEILVPFLFYSVEILVESLSE